MDIRLFSTIASLAGFGGGFGGRSMTITPVVGCLKKCLFCKKEHTQRNRSYCSAECCKRDKRGETRPCDQEQAR
jgi:hypothetical protein